LELLEPFGDGGDDARNVPRLPPEESHDRWRRAGGSGSAFGEIPERPGQIADVSGLNRRSGDPDVEEEIEHEIGLASAGVEQRIVGDPRPCEQTRRRAPPTDAGVATDLQGLGVQETPEPLACGLHDEGHAFHQSCVCSRSSRR
jgi:hypothetical protein